MSQETPENRARDIWARLGQTIKSGAETIVQETKELTRVGRLKVELMSLENERDRGLREIGRKAYSLRKEGFDFPLELSELFQAVDAAEKRIMEKNAEIDALKVETVEPKATVEQPKAEVKTSCSACGALVSSDDVFCSKCGTRLVQT